MYIPLSLFPCPYFPVPISLSLFPCPYSLAILVLTREWGQGNENFGGEWMLYGNVLIRRANGRVFGGRMTQIWQEDG